MLGGDGEITPQPQQEEGQSFSSMFEKYLISPSFFSETSEFVTIKMTNNKGEPFYFFDPSKVLKAEDGSGPTPLKSEKSPSVLCSMDEIYLAPYNEVTACVDECEGYPVVHLISHDVAKSLLKKTSKCLSSLGNWLSGLVFISDVSMQFFYCTDAEGGGGGIECKTFRIASDASGGIEIRNNVGFSTSDYPAPYLLISESIFSSSEETAFSIMESLTQINTSLIDSLCHLQYSMLHEAEKFPDVLDDTLNSFMGKHSHKIRGLLETQTNGVQCDDPFILRQRKAEIDLMTRLMMREVDLVTQISNLLDDLIDVQKIVDKCPPAMRVLGGKPCGMLSNIEADPLPEDASSILSSDVESIADPLMEPLVTDSCNNKGEGGEDSPLGSSSSTDDN